MMINFNKNTIPGYTYDPETKRYYKTSSELEKYSEKKFKHKFPRKEKVYTINLHKETQNLDAGDLANLNTCNADCYDKNYEIIALDIASIAKNTPKLLCIDKSDKYLKLIHKSGSSSITSDIPIKFSSKTPFKSRFIQKFDSFFLIDFKSQITIISSSGKLILSTNLNKIENMSKPIIPSLITLKSNTLLIKSDCEKIIFLIKLKNLYKKKFTFNKIIKKFYFKFGIKAVDYDERNDRLVAYDTSFYLKVLQIFGNEIFVEAECKIYDVFKITVFDGRVEGKFGNETIGCLEYSCFNHVTMFAYGGKDEQKKNREIKKKHLILKTGHLITHILPLAFNFGLMVSQWDNSDKNTQSMTFSILKFEKSDDPIFKQILKINYKGKIEPESKIIINNFRYHIRV